jgi:hypothetical protein
VTGSGEWNYGEWNYGEWNYGEWNYGEWNYGESRLVIGQQVATCQLPLSRDLPLAGQ